MVSGSEAGVERVDDRVEYIRRSYIPSGAVNYVVSEIIDGDIYHVEFDYQGYHYYMIVYGDRDVECWMHD